ncbi:AGAP005350-PA-like protein [Anopheles sinensis]|uniref:AGAP005350-PA-like protein n=1 Tax=Anopheles sinensis TaxID=74873 RepID=A0A084W150_ANOSI|nr:AGAP005350-PA-like protein [Anopheles sinensis]
MRVALALPSHNVSVYLEGMKGYPDPKCRPTIEENQALFELSLTNIYECGVTRVVNQITGYKVFYHRIIVEGDPEVGKDVISVKCIASGPNYNVTHGIVKRDVLPAGFQEPEDLEITSSIERNAPVPSLSIQIRQGDKLVTGDLTVSPGANLQMEIALDNSSAPIYGLGVNYMQVSDDSRQEETIIFNGCSVDPYLFENFNTVDGDLLAAKFRAFKFPDSIYVQFSGTVNVCVDRCKGVICSNGQTAFGRRRREISASPADPNKVYEVTMTTFIKVNYDENADQNTVSEIDQKIRQLKLTNQKLARNSRAGNVFESIHEPSSTTRASDDDVQSDNTSIMPTNENAKVEETIMFREVITRQDIPREELSSVNNASPRGTSSWPVQRALLFAGIWPLFALLQRTTIRH